MDFKIEKYEEKRPWGSFCQFTHNTPSTVKLITVNPSAWLSLQSHKNRAEFWKVVSGNGIIEIGDNTFSAKVGDEFFVEVGQKHRMKALEQEFVVLEIALGQFDENDIVRYEDNYGRI